MGAYGHANAYPGGRKRRIEITEFSAEDKHATGMTGEGAAGYSGRIGISHERWNLFGPFDKTGLETELAREASQGPLMGKWSV